MYITLSEIFDEFEKQPKKTKQDILEKHRNNKILQEYLKLNFDPAIKFIFDKIPKYKTENVYIGNAITNLGNELKRMYLFIENHPKSKNLTYARKERILKEMLESLDKGEGEILSAIVLNKFKIPHLTENLVRKTWANLLPPIEEKSKIEHPE